MYAMKIWQLLQILTIWNKKPNNLAQPSLVLTKLKHTKQNTLTHTDKHGKQVKNQKLKKMAYLWHITSSVGFLIYGINLKIVFFVIKTI